MRYVCHRRARSLLAMALAITSASGALVGSATGTPVPLGGMQTLRTPLAFEPNAGQAAASAVNRLDDGNPPFRDLRRRTELRMGWLGGRDDPKNVYKYRTPADETRRFAGRTSEMCTGVSDSGSSE